MKIFNWDKIECSFKNVVKHKLVAEEGILKRQVGMLLEGVIEGVCLGSLVGLFSPGRPEVRAEVVGFNDGRVLMMPLDEIYGISPGCGIRLLEKEPVVKVGDSLLGRIIDPMGNPLDNKGPILNLDKNLPLYSDPLNPILRPPIRKNLGLGIKAIDGLMTCGQGQRIGIMAGSGVGKSVLMGMIAKNTEADINVIALVGERGREVLEFIENDLGEEGLRRSVVVVATSDMNPVARKRGAFVAISIAEHFRNNGKNVLYMIDSLTRMAMAQREIGLAIGEPPTSKGYTPQCFSLIPRLLERGGTKEGFGSITILSTVLVEGDDINDPIGDASRSVLDGHILLSRDLANKNHYPAIDVLGSISRCMNVIAEKDHMDTANRLRNLLAVYKESEDMINIGAYQTGTNPEIDEAIYFYPRISSFLKQGIRERFTFDETMEGLRNALV